MTFRVRGVLPVIVAKLSGMSGARPFAIGNSTFISGEHVQDYETLAHEMRHVAQFRALGALRMVWRVGSELGRDDKYQPGNTTLEPHY